MINGQWLWGVFVERVCIYLRMGWVMVVVWVRVHSAVLAATDRGQSHCVHCGHVILLFSGVSPCRVLSYNCCVRWCRLSRHVLDSGSCAISAEFVRWRRQRKSIWILCYFGSLVTKLLCEFVSHFSWHSVECIHLKKNQSWYQLLLPITFIK